MTSEYLSGKRSAASLARKTKSGGTHGGRKRSRKKRCPCGVNTLARAKARGFACCKKSGIEVGNAAVRP